MAHHKIKEDIQCDYCPRKFKYPFAYFKHKWRKHPTVTKEAMKAVMEPAIGNHDVQAQYYNPE